LTNLKKKCVEIEIVENDIYKIKILKNNSDNKMY